MACADLMGVSLERRLTQVKPAANYQDAKGIINAIRRGGSSPKTMKRYLMSNDKVFGNVSGEFNAALADMLVSLTPQRRVLWNCR